MGIRQSIVTKIKIFDEIIKKLKVVENKEKLITIITKNIITKKIIVIKIIVIKIIII